MTTTFADLGVPSEILDVLRAQGFDTPFDIQISTIPDALAGRDVCGRAATGSGKTLAFGIPLAALVGKARPHYPRALVLAPTRELAEQIREVLAPLARARGRKVTAIYGGVGYGDQRKALRKAVDILVACPGRLTDLIQQGDVHLAEVEHVVIDEADRMADMGFLPEVRRLLDRTAKNRQTVLFSATLDDEVAVITRNYQRDPVVHQVGEVEPDIHSAQHHFWKVHREERLNTAFDVVIAFERTIVFSRTRRGADRIAKRFNRYGNVAAPIHGARTQGQRNRALEAFSTGKVRALVATDVAARGIHIDGVDCVLHFDIPGDEKAYLHRSGRTARAGETGVVVSLILDDQLDDLYDIQSALDLWGPLVEPKPKQLLDAHGDPTPAPMGEAPAGGRRRSGSGGGAKGKKGRGRPSRGGGGRPQARSRSGNAERNHRGRPPAGRNADSPDQGGRGQSDTARDRASDTDRTSSNDRTPNNNRDRTPSTPSNERTPNNNRDRDRARSNDRNRTRGNGRTRDNERSRDNDRQSRTRDNERSRDNDQDRTRDNDRTRARHERPARGDRATDDRGAGGSTGRDASEERSGSGESGGSRRGSGRRGGSKHGGGSQGGNPSGASKGRRRRPRRKKNTGAAGGQGSTGDGATRGSTGDGATAGSGGKKRKSHRGRGGNGSGPRNGPNTTGGGSTEGNGGAKEGGGGSSKRPRHRRRSTPES